MIKKNVWMKKISLCMVEGIWWRVSIVAYNIIYCENLRLCLVTSMGNLLNNTTFPLKEKTKRLQVKPVYYGGKKKEKKEKKKRPMNSADCQIIVKIL